ncbi:hypothetical protein AXF42_Ash009235 [Apostasia shenzhenica]|uniref:Uncharacterized protein n=1 Tax=Apostasia shenzhenica TaxID=1088818 RepID=A0A2I0B3H9_9ASPA|nr:hypothetical protein AXF42_Ash009235 [Apostasia shenzhenica]
MRSGRRRSHLIRAGLGQRVHLSPYRCSFPEEVPALKDVIFLASGLGIRASGFGLGHSSFRLRAFRLSALTLALLAFAFMHWALGFRLWHWALGILIFGHCLWAWAFDALGTDLRAFVLQLRSSCFMIRASSLGHQVTGFKLGHGPLAVGLCRVDLDFLEPKRQIVTLKYLEHNACHGMGPIPLERGAGEGESPYGPHPTAMRAAIAESGYLGMQPKLGGKFYPRLNTGERPIANNLMRNGGALVRRSARGAGRCRPWRRPEPELLMLKGIPPTRSGVQERALSGEPPGAPSCSPYRPAGSPSDRLETRTKEFDMRAS